MNGHFSLESVVSHFREVAPMPIGKLGHRYASRVARYMKIYWLKNENCIHSYPARYWCNSDIAEVGCLAFIRIYHRTSSQSSCPDCICTAWAYAQLLIVHTCTGSVWVYHIIMWICVYAAKIERTFNPYSVLSYLDDFFVKLSHLSNHNHT